MAHKTKREELLAAAKKRQRARKRAADKLKQAQLDIPRKIPGIPAWASALARRPEMVDISQLAFSQRVGEQGNIMALEYLLSQMPDHPAPPGTVVPEFLRDAIRDFEFPGSTGPPKKTRPERSPKQLVNDEIQSVALTEVNIKARKKDGSWKKGWNQKRVMREAQKKCTKERERLGLCKPKRKRKRKSSRARYDSRLGLTRRRR